MPIRSTLFQWCIDDFCSILLYFIDSDGPGFAWISELRVHFDPTLWKEYKDTAREHPMALVIQDILGVFEASGSKTLVMPASIVTAAEVIIGECLRKILVT